MKIIFATGNPGKLREIKALFSNLDLEILTMKEAGIDLEIIEDGKSFEENALIKCRTVGLQRDAIVMGEDSGIEIDALLKLPGIYSARFLGDTSERDVNLMLCEKMKEVPEEKRTARFVACLAALFPDGKEELTKGVIEGRITTELRGSNGFGYDPIFYVPEIGKTTAEIPMEEKSAISHRGQALRKMKPIIEQWMKDHESTNRK